MDGRKKETPKPMFYSVLKLRCFGLQSTLTVDCQRHSPIMSYSIHLAYVVVLYCFMFSPLFKSNLRRSVVSAWTPTTTSQSWPRTTRRVASILGSRSHPSATVLWFRGGYVAGSREQVSEFSSQSSASSLKTSLMDSEGSAVAQNSEDERLQSYRQALELDLPILDFGGLSYWKTNGPGKRKFRVLFVLGGPGAGKGTQSALMGENYPVVHLSVGELLREEQTKQDSPHRKLIKEALVAGKIVPVQVSLGLVQKAMEEASKESGQDILFLVDGFPRNEDNLAGWCRYMQDVASIWSVLFYKCPVEVLEERILERAKNSGRSDDNLESMHKRFATFESETMPIIRTLADVSKDGPWSVAEIAGNESLDNVWLTTQQTLNQLIRHDVLSANAALLQAVEDGDATAYASHCDPLWFQEKDPETILSQQEGKAAPIGKLCDAELEFVSGKHVAVSYVRCLEGQEMREKRIWVYEGPKGWRNVHFARIPLP